ncbi:MAG: hypothetical protein WCH32_13385 [Pseudomonadota bacterium]
MSYRAPIALLAVTLLLGPVCSRAGETPAVIQSAQVEVLSVGEARSKALGTTVTVEGLVTTPSGVFNSSFFDRGFAVQDRSGGVFVSMQFDMGLKVGQRVRVTGAISSRTGLLLIVPVHPNEVQILAGKGETKSLEAATRAIGEATEGKLVEVVGRITQPVVTDLPYGNKLFVDDGSGPVVVYVNLDTGIDVLSLAPGQRVRVTGFSSQYEDHYEIDPRSPRDIRGVAKRD